MVLQRHRIPPSVLQRDTYCPPMLEWLNKGSWAGRYALEYGLRLLNRISELDLSQTADDDLSSSLCHGVHRGFMATLQTDRKEETALRHFLQKAVAVGAQQAAGHKRRKRRLRFDETERVTVKETLFTWVGEEVAADECFAPWEAIIIKGEPLKDFGKRTANCDEEIDVNKFSRAKKRLNERLKRDIERSPEARRARLKLEVDELFNSVNLR
jgi:hypothetical protein